MKFLWKNVIETVARANNSKGDGCILAHCMGLGKTLQVRRSFFDIFFAFVSNSKEILGLDGDCVFFVSRFA